MEISVLESFNLPENSFISIRVGDTRRQAKYRKNDIYRFPQVPDVTYSLHVDIFTQVASKTIILNETFRKSGVFQDRIKLETLKSKSSSSDIELSLRAVCKSSSKGNVAKLSGDDVEAAARKYLEKHQIQQILQAMMHDLLTEKPECPFQFMVNFLKESSKKLLN